MQIRFFPTSRKNSSKICFFATLFVQTLRLRLGRTSALKNKAKLGCITKKLKKNLVFCEICTNFVPDFGE